MLPRLTKSEYKQQESGHTAWSTLLNSRLILALSVAAASQILFVLFIVAQILLKIHSRPGAIPIAWCEPTLAYRCPTKVANRQTMPVRIGWLQSAIP
jgi:hypothetical protein